MKKDKWYVNWIPAVAAIVFFPLILLILLIFAFYNLFKIPAEKKKFIKSSYHRDLQFPFRLGILSDETYRFYNAAVERNLNILFYKQQDEIPAYFTYQDTQYIFPWFIQMAFSEEKASWEIDYDGDWVDLNEECVKHIDTFNQAHPGKRTLILIERAGIYNESLKGLIIPDYIHIVSTYETAFENDEKAVNIEYPESIDDLYRMMCEAPEIRGTLRLSDNSVIWNLNADFRLELSGGQDNWCIELYRGKHYMTHWRPDKTDIFNNVCNIGAKGNIMVCRDSLVGGSVLYTGKLSECPYPENLKRKWGKIYRIIPD